MVLLELTTYLVAQSIGVAGTNLFYGIMPPDPDACVALYEYGGLMNEPNLGSDKTRYVFPRIQVVCRGVRDDYNGPRQKAQDVVVALTKVINQSLTGVRYLAVLALQDPFFLKRDDGFRVLIACNFQVSKVDSLT